MTRLINVLLLWTVLPASLYSQAAARIKEETRVLKTYSFSDPNPIPSFLTTSRPIYPYHQFDGYEHTPVQKKWKVITLENDFIEVYVLPEVGGKVWGAREKSTQKEFIYRNEVMKFRNISMRGPWTSGGIEFNFGLIGHSPATASPVDYFTRSNADGSVSCFVGNIDLPSRTTWTVEIRLPKDKAYFETNIVWSNPSDLPQNHYTYITAAAAVTKDMEFIYPGNKTLEHPAFAHPWPVNENGIDMSRYANDTFGTHNSFHTVGEYQDFMGGYYHDAHFGFGHWAKYEDMPGRKLWLWSTARDGAIWEDLLTDADGQYMEFQAGRSFTQYSYNAYKSPIKEMIFYPGHTDQWKEIWFPVKSIGGMKEVSPKGVLNVQPVNGGIKIGINALEYVQAKLILKIDGQSMWTKILKLSPMQVYQSDHVIPSHASFEVIVEGMDLRHTSGPVNELKRPFIRTIPVDVHSPSYLYQEGLELKAGRDYAGAMHYFRKTLQHDAQHLEALVAMAELHYRGHRLDSAIRYAQSALELNTYHPAANYFAGLAYRANKDLVNAMESFGLASRSMEYRSSAYAQMAEIEFIHKNLENAEQYAKSALDFNVYNLNALKLLSVLYRTASKKILFDQINQRILNIDALDDFALFEKYLFHTMNGLKTQMVSRVTNEMPYQTFLELAAEYMSLDLMDEAIKVLESSPAHVLVDIWLSYLMNKPDALKTISAKAPTLVFPFRVEDHRILTWAVNQSPHWVYKYYLALVQHHFGNKAEVMNLLSQCGTSPDYAPFYIMRAKVSTDAGSQQKEFDLIKAVSLSGSDWRYRNELIEWFNAKGQFAKALEISNQNKILFKDNFIVAFVHAQTQLKNNQYKACLKTLAETKVLPFEGSTQGKTIYEQAHLSLALDHMKQKNYAEAIRELEASKAWLESLGVGKPYVPDDRMADYLISFCLEQSGQLSESKLMNKKIKEMEDKLTQTNDLYEYWSFLNASKSGFPQEAYARMEKMKKSPYYPQNVYQQWAIAKYLGRSDLLNSLENQLGSDKFIQLINDAVQLMSRH